MVAVAFPKGEVDHPEELKGLTQGVGSGSVNGGKSVGDAVQPGIASAIPIFQDKVLHGLDTLLCRRKELPLLLVESEVFHPRHDFGFAPPKSISQYALIVGRNVGNGTALVKSMMSPDIRPLLFREYGRNSGYRPCGDYLLSLKYYGHFGIQESLEHFCAALHRRDILRLESL